MVELDLGGWLVVGRQKSASLRSRTRELGKSEILCGRIVLGSAGPSAGQVGSGFRVGSWGDKISTLRVNCGGFQAKSLERPDLGPKNANRTTNQGTHH